MELAIKNKWISFGGSSTVTDLSGRDVLKVKGKVFSFTRKKFVKDLSDNTLYVVRNKFFSLFGRKAFVINTAGEKIVTITKKLLSFRDKYNVESSMGDLVIDGNILGFNYNITLNGANIGHISRRVSLRDSFVLSINDRFDYSLFVALVIAIDNVTDRNRNQNY